MSGQQSVREFWEDVDRLVERGTPPKQPRAAEEAGLLAVAADLADALRPLRQARPGFEAHLEARLLVQLPQTTTPWWHHLKRRGRWLPATHLSRRAASPVAILMLALLLVIAAGATASELLRVRRPETAGPLGQSAPVVPPLLPPHGAVAYRQADPALVARETGRALAYLATPPIGVNETVEVGLLPARPMPEGQLAIGTTAIVRYRGGGHSLIVALDQPSPTMAQNDLLVGSRTIRLADGREAWASFRPNWAESNVVVSVLDGYLVVVASDLPSATVKLLASQVVLAPDQAGPTLESQPPAGMAAQPPDAGVTSGSGVERLTYAVRGTTSFWRDHLGPIALGRWHLTYRFDLGLRGDAAVDDLVVSIELPPALAPRAEDPPRPQRMSHANGFSATFGGDVTLKSDGMDEGTVRAALAEGIVVRIQWSEGASRREQTFAVR